MSHFIVLEGPDGAGTTTHAALLAESLRKKGNQVLLTAEPSTGPIGSFIRQQLAAHSIPSPAALQLLFVADRAWHVETVILPALRANTIVVCDRFALSTLMYGTALGLDPQWLRSINSQFPLPDKEIITLPAFEVCMQRIAKRSTTDVFEQPRMARQVYEAYAEWATSNGKHIVDTSKDQLSVAKDIELIVNDLILK